MDEYNEKLNKELKNIKQNQAEVKNTITEIKNTLEGMGQMVKNLPAVQETQVRSLGWEDPLEKGMATHFSVLAWEIPWSEEPGRLQLMELQRVGHN